MNKKDRGKRGFSKNPWKHLEPGIKTNEKDFDKQNKSMKERIAMEKHSVQKVRVIFEKTCFGMLVPERYRTFKIDLTQPLTQPDIQDRMKKAFPECVWRDV